MESFYIKEIVLVGCVEGVSQSSTLDFLLVFQYFDMESFLRRNLKAVLINLIKKMPQLSRAFCRSNIINIRTVYKLEICALLLKQFKVNSENISMRILMKTMIFISKWKQI